jgi:hypothetical protein
MTGPVSALTADGTDALLKAEEEAGFDLLLSTGKRHNITKTAL